jgi:hypothetical protein
VDLTNTHISTEATPAFLLEVEDNGGSRLVESL